MWCVFIYDKVKFIGKNIFGILFGEKNFFIGVMDM